MNSVERYIKSPTPFMVHNWEKLLPDWQVPPQTIVIVLINSQFPLDEEGELIEQEKDRLLKQFMQWGQSFHLMSQKQGFLTEIICPKEGIPQYSKKGDAHFDLVATVHHSLGFNFSTVKGCKTLLHPRWHTAVYPGLFLSGTTAVAVESILTAIMIGEADT